jgi:hypothetical protein
MRNFHYSIDLFYPKKDITFGRWGFNTYLDTKVALALRDIPIKADMAERLQVGGREIISGFKLDKLGKIKHPYVFVEDSCLLRGVQVPGDACDLSLGESETRDYVSDFDSHRKFMAEYLERKGEIAPVHYTPHNIDNQQQASALLSLWLNWANTIVYAIPEQP